jgi:hypothetical protein
MQQVQLLVASSSVGTVPVASSSVTVPVVLTVLDASNSTGTVKYNRYS